MFCKVISAALDLHVFLSLRILFLSLPGGVSLISFVSLTEVFIPGHAWHCYLLALVSFPPRVPLGCQRYSF